jgi:hypothetical protein
VQLGQQSRTCGFAPTALDDLLLATQTLFPVAFTLQALRFLSIKRE